MARFCFSPVVAYDSATAAPINGLYGFYPNATLAQGPLNTVAFVYANQDGSCPLIGARQSYLFCTAGSTEQGCNGPGTAFDKTYALQCFTFFFTAIIVMWSVAKGCGIVLSMIRGRH